MIFLDFDRRFFCFKEELQVLADAETIVGGFGAVGGLQGILMDNFADVFGQPLLVIHIPAKQPEQWVQVINAELGFVKTAAVVVILEAMEAFNKVQEFGWCGH